MAVMVMSQISYLFHLSFVYVVLLKSQRTYAVKNLRSILSLTSHQF